jgi:ParB family transcriptional regulator, chromosome partitioning protein
MATDKPSTEAAGKEGGEPGKSEPVSMQMLIPPTDVHFEDTRLRPISGEHLLELAISIASHGLVSPIGVDSNKVLLAGGHRLAAFHLLQSADPITRQRALLVVLGRDDVDLEKPPADLKSLLVAAANLDHEGFLKHHPGGLIPARIYDFDSKHSEQRALAIEVAENEKRRNFTKEEIGVIVTRLQKAGYTNKHGKLKAGEKPLIPELKTILKVSRRSVFRHLEEIASPDGVKQKNSNRGRKRDPQWKHAYKHVLGSALLIGEASKLKEERPKQWERLIEAMKKVTAIAVEIDSAERAEKIVPAKPATKGKLARKAKKPAKG